MTPPRTLTPPAYGVRELVGSNMTIAAVDSDLLRDVDDLADVMSDLTEADFQYVAAIVRETARTEKASGAAAALAMLDRMEAALTSPPARLH